MGSALYPSLGVRLIGLCIPRYNPFSLWLTIVRTCTTKNTERDFHSTWERIARRVVLERKAWDVQSQKFTCLIGPVRVGAILLELAIPHNGTTSQPVDGPASIPSFVVLEDNVVEHWRGVIAPDSTTVVCLTVTHRKAVHHSSDPFVVVKLEAPPAAFTADLDSRACGGSPTATDELNFQASKSKVIVARALAYAWLHLDAVAVRGPVERILYRAAGRLGPATVHVVGSPRAVNCTCPLEARLARDQQHRQAQSQRIHGGVHRKEGFRECLAIEGTRPTD